MHLLVIMLWNQIQQYHHQLIHHTWPQDKHGHHRSDACAIIWGGVGSVL